MPRRKFIDKKSATTFSLVHRAQDDPLIHDNDANPQVFVEKQSRHRPTEADYAYSSADSIFSPSNNDDEDAEEIFRSSKTRRRGDLEEEFGLETVRENEGEAAQHGVFYDDSAYDYMQHLRDLNAGGGSVQWIEASAPPPPPAKKRQKLEDALRTLDLEGDASRSQTTTTTQSTSVARSLLPEEILPSEFVLRKRTYQDQQDVPDEIAGFQPDIDPELREALRALDDEEYLDDVDEGDIFTSLVSDGYEIDKVEFERIGEQEGVFEEGDLDGINDDDDGGWESDTSHSTIKPGADESPTMMLPDPVRAEPPADPTGGEWLNEYKKFKQSNPTTTTSPAQQQQLPTPRTRTSHTTASKARTEQLQLLDARYEKLLEREYNTTSSHPVEEEENTSQASSFAPAVSSLASNNSSRAAEGKVREDFDAILDEFLETHSRVGKKGRMRVVRRAPQSGMEQLEEVRRGLGPARVGGGVGG